MSGVPKCAAHYTRSPPLCRFQALSDISYHIILPAQAAGGVAVVVGGFHIPSRRLDVVVSYEILSPHAIGSSSLRFAKPLQRGRQEFHVQRHQEEQVCPEEEPIEAVTVGITEKIEEDDVG